MLSRASILSALLRRKPVLIVEPGAVRVECKVEITFSGDVSGVTLVNACKDNWIEEEENET